MKKIFSIAAILICFTAQAAEPAPTPPGKWSAKMQALYQTLSELLTDVSSDQRYSDPSNRIRIRTNAEKIASLSHELWKKDAPTPDLDPTLPIIGGFLKRESRAAVSALQRGDRAYARSILRTIPSYCIACHTRNDSGPQFKALSLEPTGKTLSALERGEFFMATRQYDRASEEITKVVNNPKLAAKDPWSWRKAVQNALIISIRVKKDPNRTEEIINSVIANANELSQSKTDAQAWKISVQDWKNEPKQKAMTEAGLRAEAMRLMSKAREIQQYPMDRTADVAYLRASAAAHDLLQVTKDPQTTADALLLVGLSYEVINPLRGETLHQIYYESCIRKAPHSDIAGLCYKRIEDSIILSFSGSVGTDVPEDVTAHLAELRKLANKNQDVTPSGKPNRIQ